MNANIGTNIKKIRERHDINQQELAKLVGVNKASMCHYESGKSMPSLETTISIAKVLRCSLDELCGISRNSRS